MKKITSFLITFVLIVYANISLANFVDGKDYVTLDKPVKTATGDKIEVRELFWYYCPHCYNIEPMLKGWVKKLPESAEFIRHPAVYSDRWLNGAIFYYVLEQLGEVDRLHGKLMEAIHLHNTAFIDQEDFVNWLEDNGVDKKLGNSAFKSFSVRIKVNKAKVNTAKYKTKGVPVIVINGKYWTDAKHAGSESRMFKVADFLIQEESK